jgi:hypothetical protein
MAPTSVTTKFMMTLPAAPATGFMLNTGASDPSTISFVPTIGVTTGGTGATSLTNHGVLLGQGTSAVAATSAGTSGQCLLSNGASADPTWQTCPSGGTSALSGITAATGTNTISNGDNAQVWNWQVTTNSKKAFAFGENTASTGTSSQLVNIATLSTSTAAPLTVTAGGTANGVQVNTSGVLAKIGSGSVNADQVNGATVPASAPFAGTNGSNQIVLFSPFITNAQTTTYTATTTDFANYKTITVASGTFTITLVASGSQPPAGQFIRVINYGSGVVTIARSGQNINGGTSSLTVPAGSATAPTGALVLSDATNYFAQLFGTGGSAPTDYYQPYQVPAANQNAGAVGAGWSIPGTSGCTPTALSGTNVTSGSLLCTSSTSAQFDFYLPANWDSGVNPYIRLPFLSTDTTNGHTVIPTVQIACAAANASYDASFQTAQSLSTVTFGASAASGQEYTGSTVQLNSTSMTNCAAGSVMHFKISVSGSGTATNVQFTRAVITVPQTLSATGAQ